MPHLQKYMRRLPKTHKKLPMSKKDEPDFYALDKSNPLPALEDAPIPGLSPSVMMQPQNHQQAPQSNMPGSTARGMQQLQQSESPAMLTYQSQLGPQVVTPPNGRVGMAQQPQQQYMQPMNGMMPAARYMGYDAQGDYYDPTMMATPMMGGGMPMNGMMMQPMGTPMAAQAPLAAYGAYPAQPAAMRQAMRPGMQAMRPMDPMMQAGATPMMETSMYDPSGYNNYYGGQGYDPRMMSAQQPEDMMRRPMQQQQRRQFVGE